MMQYWNGEINCCIDMENKDTIRMEQMYLEITWVILLVDIKCSIALILKDTGAFYWVHKFTNTKYQV